MLIPPFARLLLQLQLRLQQPVRRLSFRRCLKAAEDTSALPIALKINALFPRRVSMEKHAGDETFEFFVARFVP